MKLTEKAGLLIALNIFKYAVGFLVPVFLVRLLTQYEYGTYQQLLLISAVVVGVMKLGLPTSIYYFYNTIAKEKLGVFVVQTMGMLAISGILSAIGVYLAAPYLSELFNNPDVEKLLPIYCIYILFFIGSEHLMHFLISQDRYYFVVSIQAGESIFRAVVLIFPLLLGYGLVGVLVGISFYAFTRFFVSTLILRDLLLSFRKFDVKKTFFREHLTYSIPVALTGLVGLVGRLLDKALIASFFSPTQFAIYAIGALEIPFDVIFQRSVANVLRAKLPTLVQEGELDEIAKLLKNSIRKLGLIILPMYGFLELFSYEFITLLFTDNYQESVGIFRIYLLLIPLHIFVLSIVPQSFGRTKLNMYIALITVSLNLIISVFLLKTIGYYGPAIATVVTSYLGTFLSFIVVLRLLNKMPGQIFPLFPILKLTSNVLLISVFVYWVNSAVQGNLNRLIIGGCVYFSLFFVLANIFGLFTQGDKDLINKLSGKLPIIGSILKL